MDLTQKVERSRTSPSEHRAATACVTGARSIFKDLRLPGSPRVVVGRHEKLLPVLTLASLSHSCYEFAQRILTKVLYYSGKVSLLRSI